MKSPRNFLRIFALVSVVAVCLAILFGGRVAAFRSHKASPTDMSQNDMNGMGTQPAARKVLYWYDPMHPAYKASKPGKAPDCGMDLVPKYADGSASAPKQDSGQQTQAPAAPSGRKILYWYDPMLAGYRSDKPGKSPMGMELIPKYAEPEAAQSMAPGTVAITPAQQQLMGVTTGIVQSKLLVRDIHTTATLTPDETKIAHIHVKVSGFIDKAYIDYVGQFVKKGQPLFTLYSPDLVATQDEYLIAKRGDRMLGNAPYKEVADGAQSLLRSARERLKLWDISDGQIRKLDETGKVSRDITFYSPITGFVTDRKVFPQTSVTPETDLYTVSDLSTIWALADVYEYELPYVHVGQSATLQLSYSPGKTYTGRISYIYPTVDPVTRTAKVRIDIPNPRFDLKPNMFADATLKISYGRQIAIPQNAVLDSGLKQTVFVVHKGGQFEPRSVQVGPTIDGQVVILSGLKPGEEIVTSGNFLIDSDSQMSGALSDMKH